MSTRTSFWPMLAVVGVLANHPAVADDLKIAQMEQDIRELKRQAEQQARRIDSLESEVARSRTTLAPPPGRFSARAPDAQQAWLNIASWDRIKPGMNELDVIQLLGPPSTLRKAPDSNIHSLVYALEIGVGSFLAGSVTLIDSQVTEVIKPALK